MKKKKAVLCVLVVVAVLLIASTAFAEEATAKKTSLFDFFLAAGWIGLVIVILSIAMVALIIEHAVTLRRDKLAPPELWNELDVLFQEEEYDQALALCEQENTFLTKIIAAGLPKLAAGFDSMEKAMAEKGEEEAIKLHQHIAWLSLISSISPMLGLLGTVWGMVRAFQVIANVPNPKPSELANGIAMALITTLLGLMVAIPALFGFFFFRNRVVRMVMEIATMSEELVERFRPIE